MICISSFFLDSLFHRSFFGHFVHCFAFRAVPCDYLYCVICPRVSLVLFHAASVIRCLSRWLTDCPEPAIVVHRHGDRTPMLELPNSPATWTCRENILEHVGMDGGGAVAAGDRAFRVVPQPQHQVLPGNCSAGTEFPWWHISFSRLDSGSYSFSLGSVSSASTLMGWCMCIARPSVVCRVFLFLVF